MAIGDQDTVGFDPAIGVGHVERVVEDVHGGLIGVGAQVPVDVVREHDWRCLVEGDGDQAAHPCGVVGEGVGCDVEDVTWEAGFVLVVELEGDAVAAAGCDGPVLLVVAHEAAV